MSRLKIALAQDLALSALHDPGNRTGAFQLGFWANTTVSTGVAVVEGPGDVSLAVSAVECQPRWFFGGGFQVAGSVCRQPGQSRPLLYLSMEAKCDPERCRRGLHACDPT